MMGKKKSYGPAHFNPNTQPLPSSSSSSRYPIGPARQSPTLASWKPIHPYTLVGFEAYEDEKVKWWHRARLWLQESQAPHLLGDLPRLTTTHIPSTLEQALSYFALSIQRYHICPGEVQLEADTKGDFCKACWRHHPAKEAARHVGRSWTKDPMELLMRKKWYHLDFRAKKGPQMEYREAEERCLKEPAHLRRIMNWDPTDPDILLKGPTAFLSPGFYQQIGVSAVSEPEQFSVTVQPLDSPLSPPPVQSTYLCPPDDSTTLPEINVIPATPLQPAEYGQRSSGPLTTQLIDLMTQQDEREAMCTKREQDLEKERDGWKSERETLESRISELEKEKDKAHHDCERWRGEACRLREGRGSAVEDAKVVRVDRTRWRNKAERLESRLQEMMGGSRVKEPQPK